MNMRSSETKELLLLRGFIKTKEYHQIKKQLAKLLNYTKYDSLGKNFPIKDEKPSNTKNTNISYNGKFSTPSFRTELGKNCEIIKVVLKNDISFFLLNNYVLKPEMLELVDMFDLEYQDEIQTYITNFIVRSYMENVINTNFKETYFFSSAFLKKAFAAYEKVLENIKLCYSHLPKKFNLQGEFTFTFFISLKRKIQPLLFNFKVKDSEILEGIKNVLEFEVKYGKIYSSKKCCNSHSIKSIIFEKDAIKFQQESIVKKFRNIKISEENADRIEIEENKTESDTEKLSDDKQAKPEVKENVKNICEHKKILTKIFIPFLKIYVTDLFKTIKKRNVCDVDQEFSIFHSFIEFFGDISEIFSKIQYFDDDMSYIFLVNQADKSLTEILKSIEKPKDFKDACITLNSLVYIESTFNELQERIYDKTRKVYSEVKFLKDVRRIEKDIYSFIDSFIKKNMLKYKLQKNSRFSISIFQFIKKNLQDNDLLDIHDEVIFYIIETIVSQLFTAILQFKLDQAGSRFILEQFVELKMMTMELVGKFPLSEIVINYLKIFQISPNETEQFVDNFFSFSKGTFNFLQILKLLENSSNNTKLYLEYKRRNLEKTKK